MARTINQRVEEQFGGMMMALIQKDLQIETLQEENEKLKAQQQQAAEQQKPAKKVEN